MTPEEYFYQNWQNPRVVTIPESALPNMQIPSGNMMPTTGTRSALQRIPLRNPLAFDVPNSPIPNIEIPTRGAELYRNAANQARQIPYTGSDFSNLAGQHPSNIPPRPLSGASPQVRPIPGQAAIPGQPTAVQGASALVPAPHGMGMRVPYAGRGVPFTGSPVIEGTATRIYEPAPGTIYGRFDAPALTAPRTPWATVVNDFGETVGVSRPRPIVDEFGNRWYRTGTTAGGARPAVEGLGKIPEAQTPSSGKSTIRPTQSVNIPKQPLARPGAIGAGLSVLPVLGQFLYNQRQMQDEIGADEAAKQLIQRNISSIIRPTGISELDKAIENVTGSTVEQNRPISWVRDVPTFPGSESSAIPLPAAETGGALSYLGDDGKVTKFNLPPSETEGVLSYLGNEASRNELNKRSQSAQVGSDYYSGRLNAMDAVKQGGGYLADVQPVGVKEGQTVRYVGPTTIQARAQEPVTDFLPSVIGSTKDKKGNVVPVFGKTLLSDGNMQFGGVAEKPSTTQGFTYEVYGPKGLQGTATLPSGFMGVEKPKGGGTLSYVGGRTPEEQQAINERVASINSQTAAMRDLRNAQRLEQGLPTVEQEQQANSMNAMLERLAPAPNLSALDDAQAQLMQELKDASQLKGFGSRRIRDDRMKAAQIGLAQIAANREGALRDYATQRNAALGMMQNQQALAAKQAETERAARQWAAEQGLEWNKLDVQTQRNIADAYDQAVARDIAQKNLALNEARLARGTPGNVTVNDIKQYYNPSLPGKPETLNIPKLLDVEGIGVAPTTGIVIGKPYVNPTTGKTYIFKNENGDTEEIGLREAIIKNRELQRNR